MAEPHLDHPGEIQWYPSYGPAPVLGGCPHATCLHNRTAVIAQGPDFDRYTLDRCDVPQAEAGCAGTCRAWAAEYPPAAEPPYWTADRPKYRQAPWLHAAAATYLHGEER